MIGASLHDPSPRSASSRLEAENVRLRAEVDELREALRQARELLVAPVHLPFEWRLSPSQQTIFLALLGRDVASKEYLAAALYSGRDEPGDLKIIEVFLSKLRRRLREVAVDARIENVYGRGWRLVDREEWRRRLGVSSDGGRGR